MINTIKKQKKCKHKFIHKIVHGRSMNKENKNEYDFLQHYCIKCKKVTNGEKIE